MTEREAGVIREIDPNTPIRMHIALKMLRAWSGFHGSAGYSGDVVLVVNRWIDGGMAGPIPWPDNPFFAQWAAANGLSNVDGNVGYRFTVKIEREAG